MNLFFSTCLFFFSLNVLSVDVSISLGGDWTKRVRVHNSQIASVSFNSNAARDCEARICQDEFDLIQMVRTRNEFIVMLYGAEKDHGIARQNQWEVITDIYPSKPLRYVTSLRFRAKDENFSLNEISSFGDFLSTQVKLPQYVLSEITPSINFLFTHNLFDVLNASDSESDSQQIISDEHDEDDSDTEEFTDTEEDSEDERSK